MASRSSQAYSFQRQIPIEDGYDIVVAGGGPGGCGAAIGAARLGARVLLVESTGCLGGMGTSAMVSAWSDLADGHRMIVGGLMGELVETMYKRGHYKPGIDPIWWRTRLHGGFGYNAEGLKLLLDELCLAAGVEIRFFTRVIDADVSGQKVNGVILNNVEGHRFVRAHCFIDATGDAILSDLCGAAYREAGRDTEHIMAPTLCSAQAGIDTAVFQYPEQQKAVFQAIEDGFFSQPDRHVPGLFVSGKSTAIMNAGHLFGTNAVNCRSLSDGMIQGRRLAREYTAFFRKYVGGCKDIHLVARLHCSACGSPAGSLANMNSNTTTSASAAASPIRSPSTINPSTSTSTIVRTNNGNATWRNSKKPTGPPPESTTVCHTVFSFRGAGQISGWPGAVIRAT